MGTLWKFFSDEDDEPAPPAPAQQRTTFWGLLIGQHGDDATPRRAHRASARNVETERTAYHEAGHARAASVGGFTVTGMWANEDGSGLTRYNSKKNRKLSDRQRRAALVATVAGQEAEIRYLMEHHGYRYRQALHETHAGAGGDRGFFGR